MVDSPGASQPVAVMRSPRRLFVALVLVYLAVGWTPFDFQLPRKVRNDANVEPGGVRFEHGVLVSPGPAPFLPAAIAGRTLSITLELRAARKVQGGPATIFAIAADDYNADLLIAQSSDDVFVQVRRASSTSAGGSGIFIRDVISDLEPKRLVVRIASGTLEVEVDGDRVATRSLGRSLFDRWNAGYAVSLGNTPSGAHPWAGEIRTATAEVGADTTDLLAPGVLERPGEWWVLPWRGRRFANKSNPPDVTVNILGFVPLGVFVAWRRRPRALLIAACAGLAVSLVIEFGQLLLPSRDPSLVDIATNTAGAALGGVIAWRLRRRAAPPRQLQPPVEGFGRGGHGVPVERGEVRG